MDRYLKFWSHSGKENDFLMNQKLMMLLLLIYVYLPIFHVKKRKRKKEELMVDLQKAMSLIHPTQLVNHPFSLEGEMKNPNKVI